MSNWQDSLDPATVEKVIQAVTDGNLMALMKFLPIERKKQDDWFVISFPLLPIFRNPLGIVHGGITAYMLDTAMGVSIAEATGKQVVTLQMNIHYLSPGKGNRLKTFARPTHIGKSTAVAEVFMENDLGIRIAQGTGTFFYTGNPAIRLED